MTATRAGAARGGDADRLAVARARGTGARRAGRCPGSAASAAGAGREHEPRRTASALAVVELEHARARCRSRVDPAAERAARRRGPRTTPAGAAPACRRRRRRPAAPTAGRGRTAARSRRTQRDRHLRGRARGAPRRPTGPAIPPPTMTIPLRSCRASSPGGAFRHRHALFRLDEPSARAAAPRSRRRRTRSRSPARVTRPTCGDAWSARRRRSPLDLAAA